MEDSILVSIKKLLGIASEYENFDQDIIMHINTVFMVLHQLGVGPANGYMIENKGNIWSEFVKDKDNLNAVKSYIHLKVKILFDPPLNSAVLAALKESINELEFRLLVQAESK